MNHYILKTLNAKQFQLFENENMIGEVSFKNRMSYKAEISLSGTTAYTLEPQGFFGNKIAVKDRSRKVIEMKQNWQGRIILNALFENFSRTFIFKHKGVFKTGFLLTDEAGLELIDIDQEFFWKKLHYEYRLSVHPAIDKYEYKFAMILLTCYCIIYYKRRDSDASIAT
jgi:hypothetical protein